MKLTHVIYKLTFPNGKVYIGQTKYFSTRKASHKCNSKDESKDLLVYRAIRKYGWDNVKKEIIKRCAELRADFWERKFIKEFKSTDRKFGYNLDSGGGSSKKRSVATIEKIRIKKIGSKHSESSIKLMSDNASSRGKFGKDNVTSMVVLQINPITGEVIREWDSVMSIVRELGLSAGHISQVCNSKRGHSGNFIWIYKKDFSKRLLKQKLLKYRGRHINEKKRILQLDKVTEEIIREWESISLVSKTLKISIGDLSRVCNGLRPTAGGFKWRFKNEI